MTKHPFLFSIYIPSPEQCDAAIRVLIYLMVFWLPYSPAVVEMCVVLGLFLWITKHILLKKSGDQSAFRVDRNPLFWPIAFFLTAAFLSALGSLDIGHSLKGWLTKMSEWFIVYGLVCEVMTEPRHIRTMAGLWFFTAAAVAVDSFIQGRIFYKDIFLGREIIPGDRATASFKTAPALGGYLTVIIPVVVSLFLEASSRWKKAGFGLLGAALVAAILLSGSRGAWAATIAGTALIVCWKYCGFFLSAARSRPGLSSAWPCAPGY